MKSLATCAEISNKAQCHKDDNPCDVQKGTRRKPISSWLHMFFMLQRDDKEREDSDRQAFSGFATLDRNAHPGRTDVDLCGVCSQSCQDIECAGSLPDPVFPSLRNHGNRFPLTLTRSGKCSWSFLYAPMRSGRTKLYIW